MARLKKSARKNSARTVKKSKMKSSLSKKLRKTRSQRRSRKSRRSLVSKKLMIGGAESRPYFQIERELIFSLRNRPYNSDILTAYLIFYLCGINTYDESCQWYQTEIENSGSIFNNFLHENSRDQLTLKLWNPECNTLEDSSEGEYVYISKIKEYPRQKRDEYTGDVVNELDITKLKFEDGTSKISEIPNGNSLGEILKKGDEITYFKVSFYYEISDRAYGPKDIYTWEVKEEDDVPDIEWKKKEENESFIEQMDEVETEKTKIKDFQKPIKELKIELDIEFKRKYTMEDGFKAHKAAKLDILDRYNPDRLNILNLACLYSPDTTLNENQINKIKQIKTADLELFNNLLFLKNTIYINKKKYGRKLYAKCREHIIDIEKYIEVSPLVLLLLVKNKDLFDQIIHLIQDDDNYIGIYLPEILLHLSKSVFCYQKLKTLFETHEQQIDKEKLEDIKKNLESSLGKKLYNTKEFKSIEFFLKSGLTEEENKELKRLKYKISEKSKFKKINEFYQNYNPEFPRQAFFNKVEEEYPNNIITREELTALIKKIDLLIQAKSVPSVTVGPFVVTGKPNN